MSIPPHSRQRRAAGSLNTTRTLNVRQDEMHFLFCKRRFADHHGAGEGDGDRGVLGAVKLTSSGQSAGELISDQAAVTAAHTVKARARNSR